MQNKIKVDRQKIIISILAVLLIILSGYVAFDTYQKINQKEQFVTFQRGVQYGYEQSIIQLMRQVSTCQQVPIYVQNQTVNLIAVECLSQKQTMQAQ